MKKKVLAETFAERVADAELTVPNNGSFALAPAMLKSNLFRPAAGPRSDFTEYTKMTATQGWMIEYKGEELRQDDLRVILALIKERRNDLISNVISFVPRTFCRDAETLNWADSSDSVEKLRASLKRLHDARLRMVRADGVEYLYSFVSQVEFKKDQWNVWLSPSLAEMFKSHVTYLSVSKRLAMKDGLLSWVYGCIKADACQAPFDLHALRDLAGSTYEQKDFNKQLKKCLETLQADGLIKGFVMGTGRLTVKK